MNLVRLYVSQDNRRWCEDTIYGKHLERITDIELEGGTVYHATMLTAAKTRGRLKQRPY
jgi:hypothetical protein